MSKATTRTRHRLQFAAAVLATVGAVYGLSRVIKSRAAPKPVAIAPFVAAPPIVPREDPPLVPTPAPKALANVSPAFLVAIKSSDLQGMEGLYTKGMNLDGTLQVAAATGEWAVVRWLLDHGADVHEDEAEPEAPILVADERPEIARLLLARGASEPPLWAAASAGAPNAIARLLAKRAPVNPSSGPSPLFAIVRSPSAIPYARRVIVEKLLAAGADPNAVEDASTPMSAALEQCGSTPPEAMRECGPDCAGILKALATHGARVTSGALSFLLEVEEPMRTSALDALLFAPFDPGATAVALSDASGERDAVVVRKLATKGVAWSFHDGAADASAPLIGAIEKRDEVLVRVMLEVGAPADQHLKDGRSALGTALEQAGDDEGTGARLVEFLLARGADVNRRLADGRTPLFAAAESGDARVITALLNRGARVNDRVLYETPLDAAERHGNLAAERILHSRGGRRAPPAESPPQ